MSYRYLSGVNMDNKMKYKQLNIKLTEKQLNES